MKKITRFVLSLMILAGSEAIGQTINKLEYFIDTDPGFGNGTNVTVTPASNIPGLTVPVNIASLSKGFHAVFFRSKDNTGHWSFTNRWVFVKDILATNASKLEYFIDTDPGFGNATNVAITASPDISGLVLPVNTSSLSKGFHSVYIRSKDDAGKWSLTNRWIFVKDVLAANASKLEYFIDTDPGFGNGTNVFITPSANVADISIPLSIASLSKGFHSIYFRSRDNSGNWSLTNRWIVFKDIAQNNLSKGEYFFDTDPGFGNGTAINFGASPGTDLADFSFAANAGSLTNNGPHLLFVRTKEANGKWSLTNVLPFDYLGPLPVTLLNFQVKAEKKQAHLTWQTTTEQNSARFDIERSEDANHFNKIGSVRAAGNSSSLINYSFIDDVPEKGVNYYRLREVDLDNRVQYSEIRTASFNESPVMTLYNNLSAGTPVNVRVNVYPAVLSIFDAAGKRLAAINITTENYSLPVAGFANGTYIAVLNKEGKVLAVDQFVLNK